MARLQAAMGKEWCPIIELARIAGDEKTPQELRVRCLAEVSPYLYPRRKAVDLGASGTLEDLITQSLAGQLKEARERVSNRDNLTRRPAPDDAPKANALPAPAAAEPVEVKPTPPSPIPEPPGVRLRAAPVEDMCPQLAQEWEPYQ